MKRYSDMIISLRVVVVVLVAGGLLGLAAPGHAWNFSVQAADVLPLNGVFAFPASAFHDGAAKYYEYKSPSGQRIRFFVVKSTDGTIRAAFDACDVCFKAKKGYVQEGNFLKCVNCGLKFRTDKVNEVTGGCNPSALKRTLQADNVIITEQDVLAGAGLFQ